MSQSEESLLRGIKRGDSQAFAVAMDYYMDMIYSLAYSMLGNPQDAEDACQEVFLRLHRAASRLRANSSLSSWLYRSCINYCVDESRRRSRRPVTSASKESAVAQSELDGPVQLAANEEWNRYVANCLLQLSPRQRAVFALRHFQGLTIREIAKVLDCAPGTVKSHLSRAIAGLKEMLTEWES